MQFAVLFSVCILILAATTALDAACARLGVAPLGAAFTALSVLALVRFTLSPCPEFSINAAAGFLPVFFLLCAIFRRERVPEKSSVLLLIASTAYAAALIFLQDADPAFLLCALAALTAAFLRQTPLFAMFTASLVPLIGPVFYACYELYAFGYAACDLSAAYVLDAQTAGMAAAALAAYFLGIKRTQPENG